MNYFICVLLMVVFHSCDPDPIEITLPPKADPEPDSLLLWKTPLHRDTLNSQSIDNIVFYKDRIVTSVKPSFGDEDESVLCYDTSGELQWQWNDYKPFHNLLSIKDEGIIDSKFFFTTWYQNYCIDILTGQEQWNYITEYGDPRINGDNDNLVFKPIWYSQSNPKSDSTAIHMAPIESGEFKEVFKIRKIVGDAVHIPAIQTYRNINNDLNLVFQNNTLFMPPNYKETIDLFSYNLTKGELNWYIENIKAESWNIHLPQIDENNIYFATKYHFYSFDKETGNMNWERLMPHDFQGSNYLLHGDLLITNLDNGDLMAISKNTGETIWQNVGLSACCVKLRIYDDKVYFGNDKIYIVDATNGTLLFKYESSTKQEKGRSNAYFLNAIAVDVENDRMYATDSYYLMCLKHPEL